MEAIFCLLSSLMQKRAWLPGRIIYIYNSCAHAWFSIDENAIIQYMRFQLFTLCVINIVYLWNTWLIMYPIKQYIRKFIIQSFILQYRIIS